MGHDSEAFIGIDTAKLRNAVAVAEGGRDGRLEYVGEIDNTDAATRKLVGRLAARHCKLTFCYEAGPTGYGLYRLIKGLGHDCIVVAPSLIPKKAGDRVKTNRRDAQDLARLLRAGELTAVWVPDERHEAMRDLTRARDAARQDLTRKRQQISSMLLRLGRHYPGIKTWGRAHRTWLANQKLAHWESRVAFEELLLAERQADERIERLVAAIREAVPNWALAPVVGPLQAMRGIDLVAAVTILAEIGDLQRFASPRQLMAYLGLVASERSTGESVKRGSITKAGNGRARRVLVEASRPCNGGLSPSAACRQGEAGEGGGRAYVGARDRMEGADAAVRAVPLAVEKGQAIDGGRDGDCTRVGGLHLGHQPRGDAGGQCAKVKD